MNWDALGATSSAIAALGVILSLLYLARQINQSNTTNHLTATLSLQNGFNSIVDFWFSSEQQSRVIFEGIQNMDALSGGDQMQFSAQMFALYSQLETVYYYDRSGQCDHALAHRMFPLLYFYRVQPGVQQWWAGTPVLSSPERDAAIEDRKAVDELQKAGRSQFTEEFVRFVESERRAT